MFRREPYAPFQATETIIRTTTDPSMKAARSHELLDNVKYDAAGLVTAVAQDHATGEILMIAYMNAATLRRTLETGVMTYWSRSRAEVWVKGQTSGNIQEVIETRIDCDGDALLFKVKQHGDAACHTGFKSCFHRRLQDDRLVVDGERVFDPQNVYGS